MTYHIVFTYYFEYHGNFTFAYLLAASTLLPIISGVPLLIPGTPYRFCPFQVLNWQPPQIQPWYGLNHLLQPSQCRWFSPYS